LLKDYGKYTLGVTVMLPAVPLKVNCKEALRVIAWFSKSVSRVTRLGLEASGIANSATTLEAQLVEVVICSCIVSMIFSIITLLSLEFY
jgi:hypothetical protein